MRCRSPRIFSPSLCGLAAIVTLAGCPRGSSPDGGDPRDGSTDAPLVDVARDTTQSPDAVTDATADAHADALGEEALDATAEAGPDATNDDVAAPDEGSDAAPGTMLLLTVGITGTTATTLGSSYEGGTWTALQSLGSSLNFQYGGGLTVLRDGRGLATAVSYGAGRAFYASWNGSWGSFMPMETSDVAHVTAPVATADGAFVAEGHGGAVSEVTADAFSLDSSTWTSGETTTATSPGMPALAVTSSGDPMVVSPVQSPYRYQSALRTSGVWGAPVTVPGVSSPLSFGTGTPAVVAVGRATDDQIVAAFRHSYPPTLYAIAVSSFRAGGWSTGRVFATDVRQEGTVFALAALPDGRVALAYATSSDAIAVGFYDGSTWSTTRLVPMATTSHMSARPVALARGADGAAELELVFVDGSEHLQHTRLTSSAAWTWTPPSTVDATQRYSEVVIAVGPRAPAADATP